MNYKFEAVLFDLGQVVLRIDFNKAFQSWAASAGLSLEKVVANFSFDEMYAAHEVAEITGAQYYDHVASRIGGTLSYESFVNGWNSIFGEALTETAKLIQELKPHYRLFALTNSNVLHREVWSVNYKESLQHFERIFCSSQLGLRKPHAPAFAKICSETGISKERFVFIDDLPANVEGAREFGMTAVLFDDPANTTDELRALLLPRS